MKILLFSTAFLTALITGLFYAYSVSVNIGLHRLPDTEYLRAMQNINRAILNPWFFISFIGTLVVLPICTWLLYRDGHTAAFYGLLAASLVYLIGTFGVTALGNVPLNEALDKFDIKAASIQDIKAQRIHFEMPWNRLHTIRTIASFVAFALVLISLFKQNNIESL